MLAFPGDEMRINSSKKKAFTSSKQKFGFIKQVDKG